jgi:hypothetical protein
MPKSFFVLGCIVRGCGRRGRRAFILRHQSYTGTGDAGFHQFLDGLGRFATAVEKRRDHLLGHVSCSVVLRHYYSGVRPRRAAYES